MSTDKQRNPAPSGRARLLIARGTQVLRMLGRMFLSPFVKPDPGVCMFIAINGAGLGHLTRCLAVAQRLRELEPDTEIVFYTTSIAVPVISSFGFNSYHIPPAANLKAAGHSSYEWNYVFARQLDVAITLHRPGRIIFDGTYPYPGLQLTKMKYRRIRWIWVRRGSSRPTETLAQADALTRRFDLVLVPGEISQKTAPAPEPPVAAVPPVVLLREKDLLSREQARTELGLDAARPAAYVQLGAGVINDIAALQDQVIAALRVGFPDLQIVVGQSPIAMEAADVDSDSTIISYPNSRYFRAFDLAVLAAGYNSVCEACVFGLPAVFIPNMSTGSDDQYQRAASVAELGPWRVMGEWNQQQFVGQVGELLAGGREAPAGVQIEDGALRAAEQIGSIRQTG